MIIDDTWRRRWRVGRPLAGFESLKEITLKILNTNKAKVLIRKK